VIVKEKRIISTGYNGTPRGMKNCDEGGCKRCNSFSISGEALGECICSHAEENAIIQAAFHGTSVNKTTLYTTQSPCIFCTKLIINSGIEEVVCNQKYKMDNGSLELLKNAKVKVRFL
ncbi:dCMP deaminase family protein, partial [Candidatus Peregrinibacteria bacterium]|nr:dCMP deaminase family protein [Candidatus Peregrinibacteria bacterium]